MVAPHDDRRALGQLKHVKGVQERADLSVHVRRAPVVTAEPPRVATASRCQTSSDPNLATSQRRIGIERLRRREGVGSGQRLGVLGLVRARHADATTLDVCR